MVSDQLEVLKCENEILEYQKTGYIGIGGIEQAMMHFVVFLHAPGRENIVVYLNKYKNSSPFRGLSQ